ncbi:hypothetical protein P350_27345 [Burkholderia cepacia JBK9]|nr:hypothetical protein P350_27345 [Burkholderia cepacia JBK9]
MTDAAGQSTACETDAMGRVTGIGAADGARQNKSAASDADARNAVYYFHDDVSEWPEELTDADGELIRQARYQTWAAAIAATQHLTSPHHPILQDDRDVPAPPVAVHFVPEPLS